ncbi:DNA alkylation repair protein [candidate division TA06 bacterium]|uniref:DNA alkylation repair protein n=1 Tax=candidate division TA06 bacterium TaxID=2250710 RepID=A0A523UUU4_UNCT6|nr:MAG: DNA alkylation repair protein [candidate division TA06 bacterium]
MSKKIARDTEVDKIIRELKKCAVPGAREGMARFGIKAEHALGVSIPDLRKMAKSIGKNHGLALRVWKTKIHEARILSSMIDEPERVTEKQMESWVKDFDSWDLCDQCCGNLFDKTEFARKKAIEWSKDKEEFVKRAGFALMAWMAFHDKKAEDKDFVRFFPTIKRESVDERNFVKKAVNWALRQIGKRNPNLNKEAVKLAKEIKKLDSSAARWIASDALRELESKAVRERLRK